MKAHLRDALILTGLGLGVAFALRRLRRHRRRASARALHVTSIEALTDDAFEALIRSWADPARPLSADLLREIYGMKDAA